MGQRIAATALAAVLVFAGSSAHASIISIDNYQEAIAGNSEFAEFFDLTHSGVLRDDYGDSYSQTTYDFRETNGQTVFDWAFEHSHGVDGQGSAFVYLGFRVDSSTPYSLAGFYRQSGAPYVRQLVQLWDDNYGVFFAGDSLNTDPLMTNNLFTLGTTGYTSGSLSGVLPAGSYALLAAYETAVYSNDTYGPSYAEGDLRFTLGSPAAAPEPSSLALLVVGSVGGLARRRFFRKKASLHL
jgi:hypothetical protein